MRPMAWPGSDTHGRTDFAKCSSDATDAACGPHSVRGRPPEWAKGANQAIHGLLVENPPAHLPAHLKAHLWESNRGARVCLARERGTNPAAPGGARPAAIAATAKASARGVRKASYRVPTAMAAWPAPPGPSWTVQRSPACYWPAVSVAAQCPPIGSVTAHESPTFLASDELQTIFSFGPSAGEVW